MPDLTHFAIQDMPCTSFAGDKRENSKRAESIVSTQFIFIAFVGFSSSIYCAQTIPYESICDQLIFGVIVVRDENDDDKRQPSAKQKIIIYMQ